MTVNAGSIKPPGRAVEPPVTARTNGQLRATAPVEGDTQARRRSVAGALFDWLFGQETPAGPLDGSSDGIAPHNVIVEPPSHGQSWVDSFNIALTEATGSFVLRYVAPLHREDPTIGYSIKKIKVGLKDAAVQCVRAIETMPIEMRNRIVQLRMQKARGADQLVFDNFYGLSICADETLDEDRLVHTLVSYSGSRFELRFEFDGEYVTLPNKPKVVSAPAPASAADANATPSEPLTSAPPPAAEAVTPATTGVGVAAADAPPGTPLRPMVWRRPAESRGTPLNVMPGRVSLPIAKLRLRSLGTETVVDLFEDGFPYSIGRHPSFAGYSVHTMRDGDAESPALLPEVEKPGFVSFVSRDHLVLDRFDPASRHFDISAMRGKNGTFLKGSALPSRFIHALGDGSWLTLGGARGPGVLEIRLERA